MFFKNVSYSISNLFKNCYPKSKTKTDSFNQGVNSALNDSKIKKDKKNK